MTTYIFNKDLLSSTAKNIIKRTSSRWPNWIHGKTCSYDSKNNRLYIPHKGTKFYVEEDWCIKVIS